MEHHPLRLLLSLLAALTLVVVLAPHAAGATGEVGSPENPVRLSAAADETVPELALLAAALADVTGLEFVVEVAGYDQEAVRWLCTTNRSSGVRIASSQELVYAAGCGTDARYSLVRFGSSTYSSEF